jgi:hypothetical protein
MKIKHVMLAVGLALVANVASAGDTISVPVLVDTDNRVAQGDMVTARSSKNSVELIGCGAVVTDNGVNPPLVFGFCQATDAADVSRLCSTFSPSLVAQINAISSYSFIQFRWSENGECVSVRASTQSIYLPETKQKE